MFERDVKKIIAYSTLSQLGLIIIVLIIGNSLLSFFHLLIHALFKALLFFCSGVIIHEIRGVQDLRIQNHFFLLNKIVRRVFFVCRLSLSGLPFLRGFYRKDLIIEFFYIRRINFFFFFLVMILVILTVLYSTRLLILGLNGRKKLAKIYYLGK